MARHSSILLRGLGTALLLAAAGCAEDGGEGSDLPRSGRNTPDGVYDPSSLRESGLTALRRAEDCGDLLTQIQDDAVAKLALAVDSFRAQGYGGTANVGKDGTSGGIALDAGAAVPLLPTSNAGAPTSAAPPSVSGPAPEAAGGDFAADPSTGGGAAVPVVPSSGSGASDDDETTSSNTNTQVEGVDEADFVKVVDNGKAMFLLHGTSLRRLKTYPAEELADSGSLVTIEGAPSEFFVTESGIAVVFSSIYDQSVVPYPARDVCTPFACGGTGYNATTKVTVVDVSGSAGRVLRELYYQGTYTSSRRYDAIVRVVLGANAPYGDIFTPRVEVSDPFGNRYDDASLEEQLVQWQLRTEQAIRKTELSDWLPIVKEKKAGQMVDVAPTCDTYFAPQAGLADYGLTHVLSIDTENPASDVGGVTILGATTIVYSNTERLVLTQPDYRYDFGYVPEQRTALHVFDLSGVDTKYRASGWVPGYLPANNAQFGIDVAADGVLRIGTTGQRRVSPEAAPFSAPFFATTTDNRVRTLAVEGTDLKVLGTSQALGHEGETLQSARFVGDRAYVVTFRQTDPLIVLDVSGSGEPKVLGEIEIPGFSQYMHPLDQDHLITFGQSGASSSHLQLFDVSHPETKIPPPKVLDFGGGSSSTVAYDHKAFTYFAEQQLIALPVYGQWWDGNGRNNYDSGLYVVHVDAAAGFTEIGVVDHAPLYGQQGCGVCDANGCYDFACYNYGPEVRRGHFVASAAATYVYSFSYAGVIATDLADFSNVASISLPAPEIKYGGGYYGGDIALPPSRPTGVAIDLPVAQDAGMVVPTSDGGTDKPTDGL